MEEITERGLGFMAILLFIVVIGALILYERHVRLGGAKNTNAQKPSKNMYIRSSSDPVKKPKNWVHIAFYAMASVVGLFFILAFVFEPFPRSHDQTSANSGEMLGTGPATEMPPTVGKTNSVSAYTAAETFVKRNLKAPSTAKFPWPRDEFTQEYAGNRWVVRAYVDSQNGFGAMLRTYYEVQMTYLGNDNWRMDNIQFSE